MTQMPGEGPFLAFEYGASCAQDVESRPSMFINDAYPFQVSEDCLYLNIFTPDVSNCFSLPKLYLYIRHQKRRVETTLLLRFFTVGTSRLVQEMSGQGIYWRRAE